MLLKLFDETKCREAAQLAFPNQYIEIMESDIYLKDTIAGRYAAPWLDHEFYVSTDYAYEDKMVNGNQTRYKVGMQCILVKPSRYEVVYDTKDSYFAVYEEDGNIKFMKYIDILPKLVQELELLEEIRPV